LPGDAPAHRGVRLARSRARARARGAAGRPPAPAACGVDALRRAHAQHAPHARVLRDGARRTPVRHHPAARLLDRGAVPDALHLGLRLRGAALGHQLGRRGSGRGRARDRADLRAVAAARDPPPGGPHRDPAPDQRHHRAREEHLGRGRFCGGRARRDGPTPRAGHPGRGRDDPRWDRAAVPRVHDPGRSARDPPREEGGVRTMSSVLYDAPGPVARRRELWGSIAGSVLILVGMFFAVRYAAGRGVFQLDRWDVLWDPPKNQSAATVWRSLIVQGLGATLRAAALAAPLALGLGLLLALWRRVPNVWLRAPAIAVVEVARGLPVLLVMLFGWLGFNMQPFAAVVFGLTLYNMAIFAEILRAGLAALPRGQAEASLAIGMTRWQTLVLVELPQAVRTMTPSLIAQLVVLLKDSSLGFIIGYVELLRVIQRNTQFFGAQYTVALFVVGAAVYLAINISLSQLAVRVQRRGSKRTAGQIDQNDAAAELPAGAIVLDPSGGPDRGRGGI